MPTVDYCREIETYLCQKNEGHLVRVVGPSFEVVSRWQAEGVPLKVAFQGIDRYFERYYRKGPRRRPIRIDFCEPDVLDVFDEWRRALGLPAAGSVGVAPDTDDHSHSARPGVSLAEHVARAVIRLTSARATGVLGPEADSLIDRVSRELDAARASARGLRGDARRAVVERLDALDAELVALARAALDDAGREALVRDADAELAGYRDAMTTEAYHRAREAAIGRLARERRALPTIAFV